MPHYDKKPLHFGISISPGGSTYKVFKDLSLNIDDSIYAIETGRTPGITLGIISNVRIGKYIDFRFIPGLSMTTRSLTYRMITGDLIKKNTEFTNVEFPFHLKLKSERMNNFRFYTIVGLRYSLNMASNSKATDQRSRFMVVTKEGAWYSEYGVGMDFYLAMSKISIELKLSDGLHNIKVDNPNLPYSIVIDRLIPKSFLVSFHFE